MGKIQVNDPIRPRELTRLCAGETVDVALPEDVDNEGVLTVLGTRYPRRNRRPCFEALQRRLEAAREGERDPGMAKLRLEGELPSRPLGWRLMPASGAGS
jgi:hypothetical protein